MAKLIRQIATDRSRSTKILMRLAAEKKVTVLTTEESYELDRKIEIGFKKINEEYTIKERNSLISVARLESSSILK